MGTILRLHIQHNTRQTFDTASGSRRDKVDFILTMRGEETFVVFCDSSFSDRISYNKKLKVVINYFYVKN